MENKEWALVKYKADSTCVGLSSQPDEDMDDDIDDDDD
jgi:hypothetical protein